MGETQLEALVHSPTSKLATQIQPFVLTLGDYMKPKHSFSHPQENSPLKFNPSLLLQVY